jgi:DNA-directed RNA polymerase subunit RPC12/RpoP
MKPDSSRLCPYCGSSEVFRSHRRGTVERYLLRAIAVRPYRCVNCDARFYGRKDTYGPTSQDVRAA